MESSFSISTIPILVGRTAPCGRIIILWGRSWQNDFSNSRSRITAWVARFLLKRSWRTVPVARYLTNVSVCFIQLSKSCGESVLLSCKSRCRAGKRGLNKSCSAVTACYSSSISKAISNPKIILISASLMSPFNSISTTI